MDISFRVICRPFKENTTGTFPSFAKSNLTVQPIKSPLWAMASTKIFWKIYIDWNVVRGNKLLTHILHILWIFAKLLNTIFISNSWCLAVTYELINWTSSCLKVADYGWIDFVVLQLFLRGKLPAIKQKTKNRFVTWFKQNKILIRNLSLLKNTFPRSMKFLRQSSIKNHGT